jgi:hypothetical protein
MIVAPAVKFGPNAVRKFAKMFNACEHTNNNAKNEAISSKFAKTGQPALVSTSITTHDALFPALHGNGLCLIIGVLGRDG